MTGLGVITSFDKLAFLRQNPKRNPLELLVSSFPWTHDQHRGIKVLGTPKIKIIQH